MLGATMAQNVPTVEGQNQGAVGQGTGINPPPRFRAQNVGIGMEGRYDVYLYMVRMPLRNHTNWAARAAAVVNELYRNKYLSNDVAHVLHPGYISQNRATGLSDETLWGVVRILGKNGAKVSLRMLRFTQSSNAGNALANQYSLLGGNWAMTPEAIGINWGPGGERTSDTVVSSGNDQLFDEIVFSGLQSVYFSFNTADEQKHISNYLVTQNIALTTTVEVVGSNGEVLAGASRTLQTNPPEPRLVQPRLSIARAAGGNVKISFHGTPGMTGIIQSSPAIGGRWTTESTVNPGDAIIRPSNHPRRFFRAVLQPMPR